MSQALAEILRQWTSGYDPAPVPASVQAEAQRKLAALQASMAPASAPQWATFLRPLSAAVRNPQTAEAVAAFASTCATVLHDLPATLLTGDHQREACRRFAFWPAVADLDEWLRPMAAPMRQELATLRRIAAAPVAQPKAEAEPRACPQAMAALVAELSPKPQRAPISEPVGMRREHLAAHYAALADRYASAGEEAKAEAMFQRAISLGLDAQPPEPLNA
ncbi:MAG TPA: hypothetical protein VGN96_19090 [Roseococcus sp.]|jgi:hypothetical protein|nr:hypothetical protein [Roseococcus sp.]